MSTNHPARIVLGATLGTFFAPVLSAQLGHSVDAQKISDTAGGFTALLDDEDQFGRAIVNLGDLDGDGVTDLLVSAHTDDDGGIDQGAVYVLFMEANGFVKSWQKISDTEGGFADQLDPGDQFGRAAANVGDLDGDGVVDVVVSSNYDDDGGANKGAVYVLFLNADGTVKSWQKISQLVGGLPFTLKIHDEFGRSITPLGDMNGDGTCDIVVGTPEDDDGGTNTGALHVLFLNTDGTVQSYRRISRSTDGLKLKPGDWFGHCTTNIGDFDHDGVTDLAVGSVLDDDGGVNQGSLWLLMLNANGSVKQSFEINELYGNFTALDEVDQFGTSVANIGDLDGDGVTDLAVGAVKDDDGGREGNADADVGAVYVLFLNENATVKSFVKLGDISGNLPFHLDEYDWFGSSLARLGGAPNDGLWNLAIGCRNDDDSGPNRGSLYLVQLNDGTAPVTDFTASRQLGVAPLTVQFTDASAGEVSSWVWNFSDGPQSTQQHPSKTFTTPGEYDITLTARGPKGRDIEARQAYITVVAGPLADFSATPTQGISPLTVQFDDLSEGTVTAWSWNFGDGSGSSAAEPQHVFAPGAYDVSLTVSGPNGTHTKTRAGYVVSEDLTPGAAFTAEATTGFAPHTVHFSDTSTGLVSGWSWSFGDGATSTLENPSHTFSAPGSYTIALTATGPYGVDTETRVDWILVEDPMPVADFAAQPGSGFAPLAVSFQDLSGGLVTSWTWDFGDGTGSSAVEPSHVYEAVGTYGVTLTVSGPAGSDTLFRAAAVVANEPPPTADFEPSVTSGFAPLTLGFTSQSSGTVTSYAWELGDGSTSSESDPAHTYAAPGVYTVTLTVSGPAGSGSETKTDLITVLDPTPVADFTSDVTGGFVPLTVGFEDLSAGLVTTWAWEFGDGTTSAERAPVHTYTAVGSFLPRLTISGPSGTDVHEASAPIVVAWEPPVAQFASDVVSGVAPLAVQFSDQSAGDVTQWAWSFGDGASASDASPAHVYTVPGTYTVTLTATGPAGSDAETKSALVTVQWPAPVASFDAGPRTGFLPLTVAFADLSTGNVTSWSWSFGDGSTARARHPVKNFTRAGSFMVTLTVKGPGGTRTFTQGPITVQTLPTLVNGGFEATAVGATPALPWSISGGSGVAVSDQIDSGFPREGLRYCELSGEGSANALPPSNPGGEGSLPVDAVELARELTFQALAPALVFDAALVLGDLQGTLATNDFLSVDVSDGTRHVNLYFADSFADFTATSTRHGLPMTAPRRVVADLRLAFPGIAQGTPLTLRVSVGNGGDGSNSSYGYVDGFRLAPVATATFRNGTGRNAARYVAGPAVLGGSWTVSVDVTGHAGARAVQLVGMQRPAAGTLRASGELLVSGKKLFAQNFLVTPGVNVRTFTLPLDNALIGAFMATQATITGGVSEGTNAYDLVLGF
ncbi:MAG: PKD domain-containing protein [Planctomycetota bacterium]